MGVLFRMFASDEARDALFREAVAELRRTAFVLNSSRLIMADPKAKDLARQQVERAMRVLKKVGKV